MDPCMEIISSQDYKKHEAFCELSASCRAVQYVSTAETLVTVHVYIVLLLSVSKRKID